MPRVQPALLELRQYVTAPGRRDRMIELFDTHFATAQDGLGLPILGQFRVRDDPDRLVWLRGFTDLETRPERLGAFYGGPVWNEFGAEAIGIVAGYDNVQLLREAAPGSGIAVDLATRPEPGGHAGTMVFSATTYRFANAPDAPFVAHCRAMLPACVLGSYVSAGVDNNFPALPIREGEHLFTWFGVHDDAPDQIYEHTLEPYCIAPPERLILEPTARSVLR